MLDKTAVLKVTADGVVDPKELQDLLLYRFTQGDTSVGVSGARINVLELLSLSWKSAETPTNVLSINYSDVSETKSMEALISVLKSDTFVLVTEESEGMPTRWIDSVNFKVETGDGRTLGLELYGEVNASETKNPIQNTTANEILRSVSVNYKEGAKEISKYEVSTTSIEGDFNKLTSDFTKDTTFTYQYKDADSSLSYSYTDNGVMALQITAPSDQDGDLILYQQWTVTSDIEGSYSYESSDRSTRLSFDFKVSEDWTDTLKNLSDAEGFSDRPPQVEIRNFVFATPTNITRSDYSLFSAPTAEYWENRSLGYSNENKISVLALRQEAEKEILPYLTSVTTNGATRVADQTAGIGNETFQGTDGKIDVVKQAGNLTNFSIQKIGATVVLSDNFGPGGTDTLVGIERVIFADKALAFDTDGATSAGGIYRLYKATFNREPDTSGLGYWIGQADAEAKDAVRMAEDFVWSQEFQNLYGIKTTDNYGTGNNIRALIEGFYENVLGRTPDQGGLDFYTGVIESKERTVGRVLAEISDSQENYDGTIELIANGIVFDPWVG